ncbi:MAG: hypothetical protein FWE85_00540 [Clostridiales bacterium]|nr:hypothetical protein [Clostridiales bacterium]
MFGFDYEKNIADIRTLFNNKSPHFSDTLLRPAWLGTGDKLNQIYIDQNDLYKSGKVFWGCLVQANILLFKRDFFGRVPAAPANIVFSPDPYFDGNPGELASMAYELFSYKNKPYAPSDSKEVTDSITDEMERSFNIKLPDSITKGREVYFTTIMAVRKHLPKKRLSGSRFPILADPQRLKTSMILPKRYWTKALCQNFCGK